jgi:hypothetical protein
MPRYRDGGLMGFISTNDLSTTAIGSIVKIDSSNAPSNIVLAAAGTDKSIGVLVDQPLAGQTGTVRLRSAAGTLFVKLGGTVAVGDAITSNASGAGIVTVTAGDEVLGRALQAGVSGDVIEILPFLGKY